jgi:hypothetical protein
VRPRQFVRREVFGDQRVLRHATALVLGECRAARNLRARRAFMVGMLPASINGAPKRVFPARGRAASAHQ